MGATTEESWVTHRNIGREGGDVNIIEGDILGVDKEVGPARGVQLSNPLDRHAGSVVRQEENRAEEVIAGFLFTLYQHQPRRTGCFSSTYQNLFTGKCVIPLLSITVQGTLSKDSDILTTPYPEGDGFLEVVVEVVGLPVIDVIGELSYHNSARPLYKQLGTGVNYLNLPVKLNLNIIQKRQLQLLPNDIGLAFLQEESPTVVRLCDSLQELVGYIVCIVQRGTDCDGVAVIFIVVVMMSRSEARSSSSSCAEGRSECEKLHLDHGEWRLGIMQTKSSAQKQ